MSIANNPGNILMAEVTPVLMLTRPEPAARDFAEHLPSAVLDRIDLIISPLIGIEPRTGPIALDEARGLVFTSKSGVTSAAPLISARDLPCYCVGKATTEAAELAGWPASMAGQDADMLVRCLRRKQPDAPLLHLRGAHARGDVATRLTRAGVPTTEVIVYDQPVLQLSTRARSALRSPTPVILPLFSPRTAKAFAAQFLGDAPLHAIAMSAAVARALGNLPLQTLEIAQTPDRDSMIALVKQAVKRLSWVEGDRGTQ